MPMAEHHPFDIEGKSPSAHAPSEHFESSNFIAECRFVKDVEYLT